MNPLPISDSMQDYLETILNLSKDGQPVRVTDIAQSLKLAKASVTQALSNLQAQGLIRHDRYGPVELTDAGLRYAMTVKRRHELLLQFLINVLEVDVETAEKDACMMEHAVSSATIEKLAEFMGRKPGRASSRLNENGK